MTHHLLYFDEIVKDAFFFAVRHTLSSSNINKISSSFPLWAHSNEFVI